MNHPVLPSTTLPYSLQGQSTNEHLLAEIVNSAMDAIVTIDEQHRIILFNPAAEAMFHCQAEDALGQPLSPFIPEHNITYTSEARATADSIHRNGSSRQLNSRFETVGRRFDGSEFPIEASIATLQARERTFHTVILRDITERHYNEAALRDSEANTRQLADAMPQMVFVINNDGEFEYLNQHARLLLASTHPDRWWTLIPQSDRALLAKSWTESLVTGQPFQVMHRIYNQITDETRWFLSRALPVHDTNDRVRHWYGTATDIHDQKLVESELSRTTKLLQAVLHGASEGIFVKDRAGHYLIANATLAGYLGRPLEEIIGQDDAALFTPADAHFLQEQDTRVLERQKALTFEIDITLQGQPKSFLGTKSPLLDEDGSIIGLIGIIHDITERKAAENGLRENERRLQMALAASQMGVWEWKWDGETQLLHWSPECFAIFGIDQQLLNAEAFFEIVHLNDRERLQDIITGAITEHANYTTEFRILHPNGNTRWIHARGHVLDGEGQLPIRLVGVVQDITERVHLEDQLRQAQKMEAIGQLAGGIAHDFNNLLTVINGYSNLLLVKTTEADRNRNYLQHIHDAGKRAEALTRQLLAFSRKQNLEPQLVDLNEILRGIEAMLRRLIGEDIVLVSLLRATNQFVKVDPHQIEQVVVNLAVNARDAMPNGGQLTLETRNINLDERYCSLHADVRPGNYLRLAVTDTGIGMAPEIQEHIFEPFFTTKAAGKGTGLGLATVFGIVKQSEGHIKIYSEVNVGTCFKIYLPVAQQETTPPSKVVPPSNAHGTETVLLVEDDESVRAITQLALEEHGYQVLTAQNGIVAIESAKHYAEKIHLLITDMIMPKMHGSLLAEKLRTDYPTIKTLYMSGYTDEAIVHHSMLDKRCSFINKPFSPLALAQKVREVLDQ